MNPVNQTPTLQSELERLVDGLGTDADVARGWRDIVLQTRGGEKVPVRISAPIPAFRQRMMERISSGDDLSVILPGMVAKEHSSQEFLNGLLPSEQMRLTHCAAALVVGPATLKKILCQRLGLKPL